MHKKRLRYFLLILSMMTSQYAFAHGAGGGDSTYKFDKEDHSAKRHAEKKLAEEKSDQDDWAKFMEAVNQPKTEKAEHSDKKHHHPDGVTVEMR